MFFPTKRPKVVLIVTILNKCIVCILVYALFYRQTAQYFDTPQYTGILAVFMK